MTSILFDAVTVDVTLADKIASAQSLDIPLVFAPEVTEITGEITNLTQAFVSDADLLATFANTTKVYKCGNAHYTQPGHNSTFKVGRATSTDANITASLDAIWDQDKDFFQLMTTTKVEAEIEEISDWALGKNISFCSSIEIDSSMIDSADDTDLGSVLNASSNSNTFLHAHHQAGVDVAGTAISVSSGVATVTQASHGLRVGDPVTISGATPAELNGNVTVATVPTSGTWTYTTTAVDGAATGTINYFARYVFIEAGFQGLQLGKPIGSSSWAFKEIAGQTAVPKTLYSESNIEVLRNKYYITYTEPQNNIYVTSDGFMVTGRQIVDEHVRIWLEVNMSVNIFNVQLQNEKIPYTNPGFELIRGAIAAAMRVQLDRGGLNPYSDTQDFIIDMPDALSASAANRQAGIMDTIEVIGRIGSAVLKIPVDVTLIV
jgi:hypothetical protein